jgi:protein-serine/threonine kinase
MTSINERTRSAAATDEDGTDHIGLDTPRSGVATPQPDLHDKRLPGIKSYFGQVGSASFMRLLSTDTSAQATTPTPQTDEETLPSSPSHSTDDSPPHDEMSGPSVDSKTLVHPYPTPPASQPTSIRGSPSDISLAPEKRDKAASFKLPSLCKLTLLEQPRRASLFAPLTVTVNDSSVSAPHLSNPSRRASTVPSSPNRAQVASGTEDALPHKSASVQHLKKLTDMPIYKSGTSTPTRALSTTQPSQAEAQNDISRPDVEVPDRTATSTPTPPGAQAPAARGKLTIKITEARGLKKCRDPYVVAVFQRSELISSGPRPAEEDEETLSAAVNLRAIPMQRQSSDSGRPMAIPMRSRQSSNTSITDYTTFRNRSSRRSFTNPKWDAEAVL